MLVERVLFDGSRVAILDTVYDADKRTILHVPAAEARLPAVGERVTARFYGRVSNTLNQNYYAEGFTTPGRWAIAGIRFSF